MIEFDYGRDLTERSAGPDLTPMIDVIFQLLIFFLLTSFLILPAMNVALPRSRSPEAVPPSALTLTVRRDGGLVLVGQEVGVEELPSLVSAALAGRSDAVLVVPGAYHSQQLGLLLGLAQECGMPVRALVDAAVAATHRPYPDRQLVYVDAGLHNMA
jgi:biopolymer transport protein ExbD